MLLILLAYLVGASLVWLALCLVAGAIASKNWRSGVSFWKIYGIVMATDLLLYLLIFHGGGAIPPDSPESPVFGLALGWNFVHFPATLILHTLALPDDLMWISILQDAWLVGLIYISRKPKHNHGTQPG